MRQPGFAELNAFAEVAARKSFAKAAPHLSVSRSTLSETIRGLEERLGVRLLNRTTRSVALTEAGERLLARLRPAIDEFEAALDSINAFRETPAGRLRLTVPPPASQFILAPIVAEFLAEHPAINLEISVDAVLRNIVSEGFDAGIRVGERIDRDMVALRISDELKVVAVASSDYLARHRRPEVPADLQAHNCIRFRFPSAMSPWLFEKGGKRLEVAVDGSLIVNDEDLAQRAAVDGVGVAYLLLDSAAPMIRDGRLVTMLDDWMPRFSGFYLYYPTRRQIPAPLKALITFLRRCRRIPAASRRT
jgi:DNA-binding transcriptional LysR family regulator